MDIREFLQVFNNKMTPSVYRLDYADALNHDMYTTYIEPYPGAFHLFQSYENGVVKTKKWSDYDNDYSTHSILKADDLKAENFSGAYMYKAHTLSFSSLKDLSPWKIKRFRLTASLDNLVDGRIKYAKRRLRQTTQDGMIILNAVTQRYLAHGGEGGVHIAAILYDVRPVLDFRNGNWPAVQREVNLILNGFVSSGELRKGDKSTYIPEGKAILTQNLYLKELDKYKESTRLQRKMFWVTFFAAISALGSALAALAPYLTKLMHQ
ncbi:MAG TPA: hypothetical protein VGL07_16795 [Buttiauxella sp.]|jgi:hypothetical protein